MNSEIECLFQKQISEIKGLESFAIPGNFKKSKGIRRLRIYGQPDDYIKLLNDLNLEDYEWIMFSTHFDGIEDRFNKCKLSLLQKYKFASLGPVGLGYKESLYYTISQTFDILKDISDSELWYIFEAIALLVHNKERSEEIIKEAIEVQLGSWKKLTSALNNSFKCMLAPFIDALGVDLLWSESCELDLYLQKFAINLSEKYEWDWHN